MHNLRFSFVKISTQFLKLKVQIKIYNPHLTVYLLKMHNLGFSFVKISWDKLTEPFPDISHFAQKPLKSWPTPWWKLLPVVQH